MANSNGPIIDMTPEGAFIQPAKPTLGTIVARLVVLALVLCVFALMFWTALLMLPFLLLLGVAGYFVAKSQMRRF